MWLLIPIVALPLLEIWFVLTVSAPLLGWPLTLVLLCATSLLGAWLLRREGRALVESLVVGYTMSIQRLDRVLEAHGLERIACAGRPFDPETMEVVDVVMDASRSSSEVIEEVSPGYRYGGQPFRCAQVRVARPV